MNSVFAASSPRKTYGDTTIPDAIEVRIDAFDYDAPALPITWKDG
ncbi:hypothetical protein [Nocardia sp. NPDC051463]